MRDFPPATYIDKRVHLSAKDRDQIVSLVTQRASQPIDHVWWDGPDKILVRCGHNDLVANKHPMSDDAFILQRTSSGWKIIDQPQRPQRPSASMHPFTKQLYDQIGSAWYHSTEANKDMIAVGTVRIGVTLSPDGKITQLRVLSNTSNALLERISLEAIRQARIPPVPPELLTDGKFQDELSFTLYPD